MAYMSDRGRRTALVAATSSSVLVGGYLLARAYQRHKRNVALPVARRSEHVDEYWGEKVADPYRWMEDPDSEETKAWVASQVQHTDEYFKTKLEPARSKFCDRLREVYNFDEYSSPYRVGERWFFYKKEGLIQHAVLYKQTSIDGEAQVLLDPNKLNPDGTSSLKEVDISKDATKLAYGISEKGSDWFSVRVRDVDTGEDLPDRVDWCKFGSVVWEEKGRGFFYSAFPPQEKLEATGKSIGTEVEVATGHRLMYHRLGKPSSEDQVVYQSPGEEKWLVSPVITDDFSNLLISIGDSCDPVNRLFYRDLSNFDGEDVSSLGDVVKLVDNFDCLYSYVTNEGRTYWFHSNMDAPKYKVIKMQLPPVGSPMEQDPAALAQIPKTVVIEEDETGVLSDASAVAGDRLVLKYERDAYVQLELCDVHGGNLQTIPVPGIGSITGVNAKKEYDHVTFKFTNFVTPATIYHATIRKTSDADAPEEGQVVPAEVDVNLFRETKVPGIDANDFDTKQVRYKSTDGTVVPMFIVGHRGKTGPSPCLLYGYGGFNISLNPSFSATRLLFIQHFGGRVCIANIRGGGEYGEEWHSGGTLDRKQNVFDDFISAAEYLTTQGYTTKDELAIMGGSNGGLLVGACINQRPELFAAAVAQVGVMDMLRFDEFTIGYAWRSDYGSAKASREQYDTLRSYSPVHNVDCRSGRYPAVLLTTGDHDDRVCPLHSYKYIAELQHTIGSRPGEKPLLIRIDTNCGHGAGKPTDKIIEEASDTYAFIAKHTGARWKP